MKKPDTVNPVNSTAEIVEQLSTIDPADTPAPAVVIPPPPCIIPAKKLNVSDAAINSALEKLGQEEEETNQTSTRVTRAK